MRTTTDTSNLRSDREQPFLNHGLFADHFLKARLPQLQEWREAPGLEEAFREIQRLYHANKALLAGANEAQTEEHFVKPVLRALGHAYEVQEPIAGIDTKPDYDFFLSKEDRENARSKKGTEGFWRDVVALGDAKRWGSSLDRRQERGTPSIQIITYLYHTGVRWGMLTNGQVWRLYEREKSRGGAIYCETDLVRLLEEGNPEAFKWFYLFFRKDAFAKDGFVERVFKGSADYATEVGNRLKESVYDALRHLMNGFLAHPENGLEPSDPAVLKLVHENSLIVLYRLLFLLYAEDRGLLPLGDPTYEHYSLKGLQQEINQNLRARRLYLPTTRTLWSRLLELFLLVDEGQPEARIPAYNGGLFRPDRYPHVGHTPQQRLKRWEIGDAHIGEAIDLLAYERERWHEPGTKDIDYSTLHVRHLGSIYEGLLELKPVLAREPMIEQLVKGKPVVLRQADLLSPKKVRGEAPRRFAAGEIYLATDKGERKATGSYYTPEFIVNYIVQHTVGPLAEDAAKKVAELAPQVNQEVRKHEGRALEYADNLIEIQECQGEIEREKRGLLEPYLSLKILDPAMGSGHFLVAAADFLSLAMAGDVHLPHELGGEHPQAFYKRLVAEHCLYGVDLNPLAVELAKLSLWLHTVQQDKALSFLDHHLRCGNSLVGARLDDLDSFPLRARRGRRDAGEVGAPRLIQPKHFQTAAGLAVQDLEALERMPGDSADDIRNKERFFHGCARAHLAHYRQIADLWCSTWFGNDVTRDDYQFLVRHLQYTDPPRRLREKAPEVPAGLRRRLPLAQDIARQRHFFHWELEFPEVFFRAGDALISASDGRDGQGFDAVIGNPPYLGVRTGSIPAEDKTWMTAAYATAEANWDIFGAFIERGLGVLSAGGAFGFVIPERMGTNRDFLPVRGLFFAEGGPTAFLRCGKAFEDPSVRAAVVIHHRAGADVGVYVGSLIPRRGLSSGAHIPAADMGRLPDSGISGRLGGAGISLALRLTTESTTLGSVAHIVRGMECGRNDPNVRDVPSKGSARVVSGEGVTPYRVRDQGLYIRLGLPPESKYKPADLFRAHPKVLVRFVAKEPIAALDTRGRANFNTVYNILAGAEVSASFLTALLNSAPVRWWFRGVFASDEELFPHIQKYQLAQIPIPQVPIPPEMRESLRPSIARLVLSGIEAEWDDVAREIATLATTCIGTATGDAATGGSLWTAAMALETLACLAADDESLGTATIQEIVDRLAFLVYRLDEGEQELIVNGLAEGDFDAHT